VPASLACFVESRESGRVESQCEGDVVPIERIAYGWRDQDPLTVDAAAVGLTELANMEAASVRANAVALLGILGVTRNGDPGRSGTVEHLTAVYGTADYLVTKHAVLFWMPQQTEVAAAVEFLGTVAMEPVQHLPAVAVGTLSQMGEVGRAELRRIHENDLARSHEAKRSLGQLAKTGFVPAGP